MIAPLLITIGPPLTTLIGVLVLWRCYRQPSLARPSGSAWNLLGKVIGWVLFIVGLMAVTAIMSGVFFLFVWLAAGIVLISIISRYWDTERESLLWALMVAAERGIPLETAARAFGEERNDLVGVRARQLADYLEAGVPLALALQRTQFRVPPATMLAADLGQQTGRLAATLRQAVVQEDDFELTFRSMLEKIFYLGFLVFFNVLTLGFLMVKIIPVLQKIIEEFQMGAPPGDTQVLVFFSEFWLRYGVFFAPLLMFLLLLLLGGVLYYMGLLPHRFPLLRRLWWRVDCAWVMRWLANGIRQKRPLVETMRLLAGYFPQPQMRTRLAWAANRIDMGADWCDSLRQAGIIRNAEYGVFKTAERVGNLEWALDEMAEGSVRRMACRLRAYISIAFPLVILLIGVCVLYIERGVLMPLVSIIRWMVVT
jgi:type II secretory pathway component PulF